MDPSWYYSPSFENVFFVFFIIFFIHELSPTPSIILLSGLLWTELANFCLILFLSSKSSSIDWGFSTNKSLLLSSNIDDSSSSSFLYSFWILIKLSLITFSLVSMIFDYFCSASKSLSIIFSELLLSTIRCSTTPTSTFIYSTLMAGLNSRTCWVFRACSVGEFCWSIIFT